MGDLEGGSKGHSFGEEIFMFVKREDEQRKAERHCQGRALPCPSHPRQMREKQDPSHPASSYPRKVREKPVDIWYPCPIFFTEEHDVHCSHRGILCPGQRFRSSHPILVLSGWAPIPHPMNCLEPAKPAKLLEYHRWQGSNHTIIQFPVAPCMLGGTSPEPQHLRARVVLKSLSANLCYRLYFPPTDLREDCCGPAGCFQREAPFLHASCLALFPAARTAVLTLQI